jgi:Pyridoxamine 5'-phosphate oxidase
MANCAEFVAGAPQVAETFLRRHAATGGLCMLATLRSDGFPRISPLEPRMFEGQLWLGGMPNTMKFRDLFRDPRFSLHTATIDTHVSDGDAKLWGVAHNVQDPALHHRYADWLFQETGFDLRGQTLTDFYAADLAGASSVEVNGGHLDIRIWKPGEPGRVVRKH